VDSDEENDDKEYMGCVMLRECVGTVRIFSRITRITRKGFAAMKTNLKKPQLKTPSDAIFTSTTEFVVELLCATMIFVASMVIFCL
jgi:hypothetical protein